MARFYVTVTDTWRHEVEADSAETAYEALHEDGARISTHINAGLLSVEPIPTHCTDCENELDQSAWRYWKYEPNTSLCDDCFDQRINEEG